MKRGQRFKKTNVFLIPSSYKKTPHECKGLHGCFGRGFFEGAIRELTAHRVRDIRLCYFVCIFMECLSEASMKFGRNSTTEKSDYFG